jgi:hypothetical protein
MIQLPLVVLSSILASLTVVVLCARPQRSVNHWFAVYTRVVTVWTFAGAHRAHREYPAEEGGQLQLRVDKSYNRSLSGITSLASLLPSSGLLTLTFAAGVLFAALSMHRTRIPGHFRGDMRLAPPGPIRRRSTPRTPSCTRRSCWPASISRTSWPPSRAGVVAIDAGARVTMFNRSAEQLTGLRAGAKQEPAEALPLELTTLLKATVADAERTKPEVALPDGTTTAADSPTRF